MAGDNEQAASDRAEQVGVLMGQEPILQFFRYEHLPTRLQQISKRFADLAVATVLDQARNPERTVALRKLLEAKDAAVRAELYLS